MGDVTKIQWTDHTFNPWIGCTKVHTGCKNCYAEADMDTRRGRVKWGPNGTRSRTSDEYWKQPIKWGKEAEQAGQRHRVFCASLADVFEDWTGYVFDAKGQRLYSDYMHNCPSADPISLSMRDMRVDLFRLIDATPWLEWLLLTKRPENIRKMWGMLSAIAPIFPGMPGPLGKPIACLVANAHRPNVWLGTSVSDQETADKAIPELLKCRDLSPVLFLSVEPLLGPIDLQRAIPSPDGFVTQADGSPMHVHDGAAHVDWVIVGGESGPNARPCNAKWIRDIVDQCQAVGVPCFVKQLGSEPRPSAFPSDLDVRFIKDKKGGDPAEWPEDLRVREFPKGN